MERAEVSQHQVQVFRFVREAGKWVSNKEIAAGVAISERTIRAHTRHFVQEGIFDQAEVFPGHRYRLAAQAAKRNKAYILRLQQAEDIFA